MVVEFDSLDPLLQLCSNINDNRTRIVPACRTPTLVLTQRNATLGGNMMASTGASLLIAALYMSTVAVQGLVDAAPVTDEMDDCVFAAEEICGSLLDLSSRDLYMDDGAYLELCEYAHRLTEATPPPPLT